MIPSYNNLSNSEGDSYSYKCPCLDGNICINYVVNSGKLCNGNKGDYTSCRFFEMYVKHKLNLAKFISQNGNQLGESVND
ncbi:MAG: hypothetical protein KKA64_04100 [Nanoarchaeota archaeon]|nr:hypothetical protein [Nanoarchaeota archaeon]